MYCTYLLLILKKQSLYELFTLEFMKSFQFFFFFLLYAQVNQLRITLCMAFKLIIIKVSYVEIYNWMRDFLVFSSILYTFGWALNR